MVQYQKFMFDNFVITCDDEKCAAEPLELEEIEDAEQVEEPVKDVEAEVVEAEPEVVSEAAWEPEPEPEPELEPETEPEPGYSQEELDAAVSAAEQKGYDKGFAAAADEKQQAGLEVLEKLSGEVSHLLAGAGTARKEDETAALKFALSVVRKILPHMEENLARVEIEGFLRENFARFRTEKSLSFALHPDMAAEIAPLLSKLAEKNDFEGKIAVHKDAALGLSDCRVEWSNGGVERRTEQVLNNVEELLNQ